MGDKRSLAGIAEPYCWYIDSAEGLSGSATNLRMRPVRTKLPFADQKTLWQAVCVLERESFVARVSALSGEPVTQLLKVLPSPVTRQINRAVQGAMQKALDLALYRLDSGLPEPGEPIYKIASGVTGGVGGFFGLATLTVELPVTTTLMLRSIAGIARRHGEDLTNPASRLACLEVFALGPQDRNPEAPSAEASYFAVRSFLAKAVGEAADAMAQRAIAQRSTPAIVELVTAIGSRFGLVVSEKVAAGAIPIVGAVGAAAINLAFMDHFQKLANAHFAVRRLERRYGQPEVVRMYEAYAPFAKQRLTKGTVKRS